MSGPIKVGDLVIVLRDYGCCCHVGKIYPVLELRQWPSVPSSCYCGQTVQAPASLDAKLQGRKRAGWLPVIFLKRIPPLSELEGERTQEDIREPA